MLYYFNAHTHTKYQYEYSGFPRLSTEGVRANIYVNHSINNVPLRYIVSNIDHFANTFEPFTTYTYLNHLKPIKIIVNLYKSFILYNEDRIV